MATQTVELESITYDDDCAIIHVISDSLGATATGVVAAAAAQFKEGAVKIEVLAKVTSVDEVRDYFKDRDDSMHPTAVFHTIVNQRLRSEVRRELDNLGIASIDLLGPAINVLATLTGTEPRQVDGAVRETLAIS